MLESMLMVPVKHSLLETQDETVKQIFIPYLEKEMTK